MIAARFSQAASHARGTLLLLLSLAFVTSTKSDTLTTEEETLKRIVTELERAVSIGEKEAWQKYMADDGILINRDGSSSSKQDILNELAPKGKGIVLDIVPVNVRVFGNGTGALVSFLADEKLSVHGQKVDTRYPSVMYFEKRNGEWQIVFFSYFEQPVDPPAVTAGKEYLSSFAGVYRLSDASRIEIAPNDTALIYRKIGSTGAGTVLYPIDHNGRFFRRGTESEFIFDKDEHGREVLRQRRNWIDLVWYKE